MPIKLRPTSRTQTRSGQISIEHYYIKTMSLDSLFKELNNYSTRPKVKQKLRNEIIRREAKIVKRTRNG
jgi:hypothetical protein